MLLIFDQIGTVQFVAPFAANKINGWCSSSLFSTSKVMPRYSCISSLLPAIPVRVWYCSSCRCWLKMTRRSQTHNVSVDGILGHAVQHRLTWATSAQVYTNGKGDVMEESERERAGCYSPSEAGRGWRRKVSQAMERERR